jgi:hypothetical protein
VLNIVPEIEADYIIVIDANGKRQRVSVAVTPIRLFLKQESKRAILSTGFLLRYGEDFATNTHVINEVMRYIRHEVLLKRKEG